MSRHLLIFIIIAVVVFGLGYAVFEWLIAQPPESPEDAEPGPGLDRTAGPRDTTGDRGSSVEPGSEGLLVTMVEGTVERSGPEKKDWGPVVPGIRLRIDEFIRTGQDSSAKLAFDEKSEIDLAGRSEISVKEITETINQIELVLGKINVNYDEPKGRTLRVTSGRNRAVAETRTGEFAMLNTGEQVMVATATGQVKLTAKQKTVTVRAGELSQITADEPPGTPEPIPLSVMLKVANPKKLIQTEKFTTVLGRTNSGARVQVAGIEAEVNEKGQFKIVVPLQVGENRLDVVADTAWGSAKRQLPTITVKKQPHEEDTDATIQSTRVRWKTRTATTDEKQPSPARKER